MGAVRMAVNLRGRSFLKLLDFTQAEIRYLIDLSKDLKNLKRAGVLHNNLKGKNIVLLFEKTSTRTRCSFEVAGMDLGLGVTYLDAAGSQMGKKESIADTARVLGRMYDGIEYRGFSQETVDRTYKCYYFFCIFLTKRTSFFRPPNRPVKPAAVPAAFFGASSRACRPISITGP